MDILLSMSRGLLVSDGYYEETDDSDLLGGDWISLVKADWLASKTEWYPLCRHHSSWTSQDAHPHPVFDPSMKFIYYNSDVSGQRAIYRIKYHQ